MRGSGSQRHGVRLFAAYAVASLIPVSVLGALLIHGYQDQATREGREQAGAQAAVIEEMAIGPALKSSGKLGNRLSESERSRLQAATDLAIFNGSVSRLRLRSFSGSVAFSDDGTVLGAVSSSDPAFGRAADGAQVVTLVTDGQFAASPAIRVLQPVIASSTGQAVGVLEVYLPYQPIKLRVAAETRRAVERLGVGLAGVYAMLAGISWWTTSSLRRHAVEQEHQALHDPLTGLPNREWFRRKLQEAIARSREGELCALVLVDLDHFKEVNDTLGHQAGDELLCVVGQRLMQALRSDDVLARLGGDEFGLVLPRVADRDSTVTRLQGIREGLARTMVLNSVSLSIKASFGVSFYPDDAEDVEDLLQRADAAMYRGKHGPVGVTVHDRTTEHHPTHVLIVQQELQQALVSDELVLHYQPILTLASGQVARAEALVYWQHPKRGLLPSSEFMAVAWGSDLVEPVTAWVLRRALRDLIRWRGNGIAWGVAVSIPVHALRLAGFTSTVADLLKEAGVSPRDLHLEVAWTADAANSDHASAVVGELSRLGVSMSIDDFGTGYTNLSQLRGVPFSEVKIDETFVSGLLANNQNRAIVRSVLELAHRLGYHLTAKGVDTQAVADWLRAAGCDYAQGPLWARPAPWINIAARFPTSAFPSAPVQPPTVSALAADSNPGAIP